MTFQLGGSGETSLSQSTNKRLWEKVCRFVPAIYLVSCIFQRLDGSCISVSASTSLKYIVGTCIQHKILLFTFGSCGITVYGVVATC